MNYTIEEVLDKDIDWVNLILNEITEQELHERTFQMSMHGASEKDINEYARKSGKARKPTNEVMALMELGNMGMKIGKPSGTVVINRPNEVKK